MRSIRWAISGVALLLPPSIGAAPSVTLEAPAAEARYVAPAAIELVANPAVDAGRSIARVEFLADGEVIGVATQVPYAFSWTNVAKGNYALRARVFDSEGKRDNSPVVRVHVRNNTAPKVRLTAPEHRYIAPGAVPLSATVTDRDDPIAKVEFFNGDTLLATSTAEPYAFDWTGVPAGDYELRAKATDALGATGTSNAFRVRVRDNAAPHVRILTPDNKETFPAPASIAVSLKGNDRDDNLTSVELFANGASLAVFTGAAPYEFNWTNVTPGTYALTARATDDLGLTTTSRTVTVTVAGAPPTAEPKLYFIQVDHLNTPRLIADEQQRTVWRWDQQEPFGDSVPDENPSGLGVFEFPGRLPGQYFDVETNLHYNHFRDYDPRLGMYVESDPIGLRGGLNSYAYAGQVPTQRIDPQGLEVRFMCRPLDGAVSPAAKRMLGAAPEHCFVHVTCPQEGWDVVLSLFGLPNRFPYAPSPIPYFGQKSMATGEGGRDDPSSAANTVNVTITPARVPTIGGATSCSACDYEKNVLRRFSSFPSTPVPYFSLGPNSNNFAQWLVTSPAFGTGLPTGTAPNAPGFGYRWPGITQ